MEDILTKEEKEEQKKLKEELKEFCKKEYIKDISYIFKCKNNYYIFKKPTIKTNFCFGHGYNGMSTEEQEKSARNNKYIANTNESYFLKENLKCLLQNLKYLKKFKKEIKKDGKNAKIINDYYNCIIYSFFPLEWYKINENDERQIMFLRSNSYNFNTKDDFKTNIDITLINKTIKAEIIQLKMFKKRLYTYLKKYGLAKLHTWTYLVD